MMLPSDYLERVYAGVLGKLIGVYLGRPFEGWAYDRIMTELGEINYYVHEQRGVPLVVTDDDITGTFTFLRALADYPVGRTLSPEHIGSTWLNYIIENRSILWWGGLGNSTEHTAYLRLKKGIRPPESGSCALNGRTIAEQIGAQIFIDGWGMIAPGDPQLAVEFARRAACVSHDGEAIYAAQVIAALVAQAFVEADLEKLLDVAVSFIPHDSTIYRLIADLREWRISISDWRVAREKIVARYGYDQFPGNCHVVPNHALIHLGLLYGDNDFQKSLMITNTSGWDTDCNSGNVGCVLAIKNGLASLDVGPDWRGPVADRLFLPTADGGRCISDAVQETIRIVNLGRHLSGADPIAPKGGARFHFELPGSVQGFTAGSEGLGLDNVSGHSTYGTRSLAMRYQDLKPDEPMRAATSTFILPEDLNMIGYHLHASPTLYPGQTVTARITADTNNRDPVMVALFLCVYGDNDQTETIPGPEVRLTPGEVQEFRWEVGETGSRPVHTIGLEFRATRITSGVVYLDYLTWDGTPNAVFTRPQNAGTVWQRAWVSGVDQFRGDLTEPFRPIQNNGRGLFIQGAREWRTYHVEADIKPLMCTAAGVAACVQGLRRYYALLLAPQGKLRLVKVLEHEQTLAEIDFDWHYDHRYDLALETDGPHLRAIVNGQLRLNVVDIDRPLESGAIALVVEDGSISTRQVSVKPLVKPIV